MEKKGLYTTLIVFAAVLTVISLFFAFYTYQLPTQQTFIVVIGTYNQSESYDYTAYLTVNNTYYNNATALKPGDGILYENILDCMVLNFSYSFTSTPNATIQDINHVLTAQLESPGKWVKPLTFSEAANLLNLTNDLNFSLFINCTTLNDYVKTIDSETGAASNGYDIRILPIMTINASTDAGQILDSFAPQLVITSNANTNGSYITIDVENATKNGSITTTSTTQIPGVQNERSEALIALVASLCLLAVASGLYARNRVVESKPKPVGKIISPYRDLLSETTQEPPDTKTTVEMKSLGDLAKTAEILARPIMYTAKPDEHVFYLIDGDTKYLFRYKTS